MVGCFVVLIHEKAVDREIFVITCSSSTLTMLSSKDAAAKAKAAEAEAAAARAKLAKAEAAAKEAKAQAAAAAKAEERAAMPGAAKGGAEDHSGDEDGGWD